MSPVRALVAVLVVGVVVWSWWCLMTSRFAPPDIGGTGVVVVPARVLIADHHAQLIPTAGRPGTPGPGSRPCVSRIVMPAMINCLRTVPAM